MPSNSSVPLRRRTWYVQPRGQRWAVRRQDALSADSIHESKQSAIARAADLARRARGRVRVKALSGRIEGEQVFSEPPA